ncbi:MAG: flagellar filament capping protein FliD [Gracilimonas sp.]
MNSIQNLFQQSNPYEKFVTQLVQLESQKKFQMEVQREAQNGQKKALGNVSSAVSTFISKLDEFSDPQNKPFQSLATSSSDKSVVQMNSASGIDRTTSYDINVERLATRDTQLSQIMTGGLNDLAGFGDGTADITIGDKTETISIETQKDDGTGTMVDKTNEELLNSFADAINLAFDDEVQANLFKVNDEDVQLSISSLKTGTANKIEIAGATGALAEITNGLNRLVPENELDARFTIDGVTFERSNNTVDDAINGLDFTLKKGGGEEAQMSVQKDLNESKSNIKDFIKSFNDMNKTIRTNTFINGESGDKGPLQGMRSIRNLSVNMRLTGLQSSSDAENGEIANLNDIGISFNNDGSMKIDDEEKLMEVLNERPEEVASLFSSENSPLAQMKAQAETYTKSNGLLSSIENGIDQKISNLDRRISSEERYLADYEERQRDEFNKLQQIITQGEEQFQKVMSFRNSAGI